MDAEALNFYFAPIAAAFVRGVLQPGQENRSLFEADFEEMNEADYCQLIDIGLASDLRLHRFKRTMGLPRVAKVLGILRGLVPENLLDIGSGRGAFLWPLLDAFPELPVTAIDADEKRVRDMESVQKGGFSQLDSAAMDMAKMSFSDDFFDVTTALEVLEHVIDPESALREIRRVTRRFLVISVPSHEDDNPEHLHLLDQKVLTTVLGSIGAIKVRCEYVPGHLIAVARFAK
jgi:2-polyprenyl-3-methyl-5-hydroxy-6-metoxy-1,4-benzoquinol methylase